MSNLQKKLEEAQEKWKILAKDKSGRWHSFSIFHNAFISRPAVLSETDRQNLALHLFAYLASWGMLRNSFLMQKDYLFLTETIDILIQNKYDFLKDINPFDRNFNQEEYIHAVLGLKAELKNKLVQASYIKKDRLQTPFIRDILLSKILLGAFACIPAYDSVVSKRFFEIDPQRFRKYEKFDRKGLGNLLSFIKANEKELIVAQNLENEYFKEKYSIMKVVDLLLWV